MAREDSRSSSNSDKTLSTPINTTHAPSLNEKAGATGSNGTVTAQQAEVKADQALHQLNQLESKHKETKSDVQSLKQQQESDRITDRKVMQRWFP